MEKYGVIQWATGVVGSSCVDHIVHPTYSNTPPTIITKKNGRLYFRYPLFDYIGNDVNRLY